MSMLLNGVGGGGFTPEAGVVYYREGVSNASPYEVGWIQTGSVAVNETITSPFSSYLQAASASAGVTIMLQTDQNMTGEYYFTYQVGWHTVPTTTVVQVWDGGGWNSDDITILLTPPTNVGYGEGTLMADNLLGTAGAGVGIIMLQIADTNGSPLRIASVSYLIP